MHSEKKVSLREQLSWLCLRSEVTSDAILGKVNRLGKCNDKIKLKTFVSFDFTGSDDPHRNIGYACAHVF